MLPNNWPTSGSLLFVSDTEAFALQQAMQHARNILCQGSKETAALFAAESHPDFRHLYPEEGSQWIKIDQVRSLIQWTSGTPQIAQKQVAIISRAHTLNLQAANALLKTVEEPSLNTVLILVSHKPALIPATLKSRCFWVRLRNANVTVEPLYIENSQRKTEEESILKQKIAKDLSDLEHQKTDPVTLSASWSKQDPKQVLHWLLVILNEKMVSLVADSPSASSQNGSGIKIPKMWAVIEKVFAARRAVESPNSPNVQLLFETILFDL